MLEGHGYTRTGERFARPGGTSPSVYLNDGRSFHHNSNDALCDGHSHSAFDVFCYFEHGDNFKAALQAAAAELGLPWNSATASQEQRAGMREDFEAQARERGVLLIESNRRQLREKLRDLREALAAANTAQPRLFHGPQGLVTVADDRSETAKLRPLTSFGIQVFASEAAFWVGTDSRGTMIEVDPPRDLAENLLASPNYWEAFPRIERIATAPFFDARGQLCSAAGFYPEARAWLALPPGFSIGDTEPTPENVAVAREMLLGTIFGEVAFEDAASRAHAVALMILPFIRLLIPAPTPLHMLMAPLVSSGKSYLAYLCTAAFAAADPTSEKGNVEEWRKSLISKLMTGAPILWIDNLKKNLDSPTLDMAITSPSGYIEDRLTGTALNVRAPAWCVYMGTGNNITLTDDAASRTVIISIVPTIEDASQTVYKRDPKEFITTNRGAVCGAIITLVRAWQEAGCPKYSGKFTTRFPAWTRVMGGILETVGVPGFLENFAKYRKLIADDTGEAWSEFVLLWDRDKGQTPVSARDLLPLAQRVTTLSASLSKVEGDAKERRWAQLLVKQRNRIYAGFKITDGPTVQRRVTYVLTPLPLTPEDEGGAGNGGNAAPSGSPRGGQGAPAPESEVEPTPSEMGAASVAAPTSASKDDGDAGTEDAASAPEPENTPAPAEPQNSDPAPENAPDVPEPEGAPGDSPGDSPGDAAPTTEDVASVTPKEATQPAALPPCVAALSQFMRDVWGREWLARDIVRAMKLRGMIALD